MGRKDSFVAFRLDREERRRLKEQAEERGMTESAYLRFLLHQKPLEHPEIQIELRKLTNEVNHVGVNINQIVKNHNASLYSTEDKKRLFSYMQKLNMGMKKVGDTLGDH